MSEIIHHLPIASLTASIAMAVACAVLSVLVVPQRWTFIGEGIGHSGLGGAGTAWMLALMFPWMNDDRVGAGVIILFCLLTALAIGVFTRRQRVNSDAAIGIFMVASLAWGFLAYNIYLSVRHSSPIGYNAILWGQTEGISRTYALASIALAGLTILTLHLLRKEILSYCLDPILAETSGVPTALVHYLLILLMAVTVLIGMRIVGSILVTALLILPGTIGMLLSARLRGCVIWAISVAIVSATLGILAHEWKAYFPAGPVMVLVLFGGFVVAYIFSGKMMKN